MAIDDDLGTNTPQHYLEEAAFLWLQRANAVHAPNYTLSQLAALDERLEAHIDGLRVAGEEGWRAAAAAASEGGEAHDVFPAAVLALEARDDRFDELLAAARDNRDAVPGLISALGWADPDLIAPRVRLLRQDASPFKQMLGLAACDQHRKDPGAALAQCLASPAANVRIRALRAAGDLGRTDLLRPVLQGLADRRQEARFFSARSGVLLGDRANALGTLAEYAARPGRRRIEALQLALMASHAEAAHDLMQSLPRTPESDRLQIIGAGTIGGARYVPWLIERMKNPLLARIAAEAFVNITGADFNLGQLEAPPPDDFEDGPTEDPDDEDVEVPEDIALPWPDIQKIEAWWKQNGPGLAGSSRLLLGAPLSVERCMDVLRKGFQRQRRAAALHICLLRPGIALFNTAAPARRQLAALQNSAGSVR